MCLVPERRQEVTTEGGLDVVGQFDRVRAACARLAQVGCRVSLFIGADPAQIDAAAKAGARVLSCTQGLWRMRGGTRTRRACRPNWRACVPACIIRVPKV